MAAAPDGWTRSLSRPPSSSAPLPPTHFDVRRVSSMRRHLTLATALVGVWLALATSVAHADRLRIVTTTTDLKALTEAVTGDLAEVDAMARANQNPHDLEVRPSLMVKLRRADAMVVNGLELDDWADVVARGSNNPNVIPGAQGRIDASRGILVLEVPKTRVDRSMGAA